MHTPKAVRDFLMTPTPHVENAEDLANYRDELDRIKQEIANLTERYQGLEKALISNCDHRFKAVTSKRISGDYYNTGETRYTVTCVTCCATLFEHSQSTGSYG